jgi:hypothetical protein
MKMPANGIFQSCLMNKFITNNLHMSVNRKRLHVSAIVYSPLQGSPTYSIQVYAKVIMHDLHPEDIHGVGVGVGGGGGVSFWD